MFARLEGADPDRGALLLHGHLDVVPAEASDWSVHPFSGAVEDGYVWGRGAVDMKDMVGMMIAVARHFKRAGIVPPRDLVFAFVSDEEAGGKYGCQWLVDNRPDLFEGVTEAVGEVGGFSLTVPRRDGGERRLYLIETAEKAHDVDAADRARPRRARIADPRRQRRHRGRRGDGEAGPPSVPARADRLRRAVPAGRRGGDRLYVRRRTRPTWTGRSPSWARSRGIVGATLRDTANPTMLKAGYKANVIPATAEAVVDCRVLPGRQAAFEREVDELIGPDVTREWITELPSYETTFDGDCVDAMNAAILAADPDARTVPYMLAGGTDAKAFARLGIRCFGFAPLRLPPDLDFAALFHGVDERVPVDALKFGTQVLEHFLLHC